MEKPQNYLSRLRRHPLLWNLALIAAIILAMVLFSKDYLLVCVLAFIPQFYFSSW